MLTNKAIIACATSVIALSTANFGAVAYADGEQQIEIGAQSLASALIELSSQTDVVLVAPSELVRGKSAPAISGAMEPGAALDLLLAGTGLDYTQGASGEYQVVRVVDQTSTPAETPASNASDQSTDSTEADVEEFDFDDAEALVADRIVVTGSRLQGVSPASPVTIIGRTEIDARGISSVDDILRYIPQNFTNITSAGATDGRRISRNDGASTVNLRGLGEGATLILVNGRRISASAADDGTFTDISTIPFAAIERVEVLTDGASAIYGSDAVAGVVNFILRKDYRGAQTRVRYENSSTGGNAVAVDQTAGFSWDGGNLTGNISYRDEDAADRFDAGLTDIADFTAQGGRTFPNRASQFTQVGHPFRDSQYTLDLTPNVESWSGALNFTQSLTEKLTLNLSGTYSERQSVIRRIAHSVRGRDAMNVPFSYAFFNETDSGAMDRPIRTSDSERYSFNGSLTWQAPIKDWEFVADFGISGDENTATSTIVDANSAAFVAALASGDLDVMGDGSMQNIDLNSIVSLRDDGSRKGEQEFFGLLGRGSVFELPAGDAKLSAGVEFRTDKVDFADYRLNVLDDFDASLGGLAPEFENQAYFAELFIPLVSPESNTPMVHELNVQIAGRYDNYDFNGPFDGIDPLTLEARPFTSRSFNDFVPKIGVVWYPKEQLKLRATWGEAFQAPGLADVFEPRLVDPFFQDFYSDPRTPVSNCDPFFQMFIPDCVQVDGVFGGNPNLSPQTSETYTIGFDYSSDVIENFDVSLTYNNTQFEDRFASLFGVYGFAEIFFSPDPIPLANSELFPEIIQRAPDGTLTFFDPFGTYNLGERNSETLDFTIQKGFEGESGTFVFGLEGSHFLTLEDVAAPGLDPVDNNGTDSAPPQWNVRGFVDWFKDDWSAGLVINHTDSYTNTDPAANLSKIDGYTTVDFNVGYDFKDSGWRLSGGVNNLFDEDFPFVDDLNGVDSSRVDFRKRVMYIELNKEFSF